LDLGKLFALLAPGDEGEVKAGASAKGKAAEPSWTLAGKFTADTARLRGYVIRDLQVPFEVRRGNARLEPVAMKFAGGDPVDARGQLRGSIRFYLSGPSGSLARSVSGKGEMGLTGLELKKSAVSGAVASFTGVPELASPRFDKGHFLFNIEDRKVGIRGELTSRQAVVETSGTVDFDRRMDVIADLRLAPQLASRLPAARLTGYMKDEKGWTVVPLKITGTTERPTVGLNPAAVGRRIGRDLQEKFLKGLFGR